METAKPANIHLYSSPLSRLFLTFYEPSSYYHPINGSSRLIIGLTLDRINGLLYSPVGRAKMPMSQQYRTWATHTNSAQYIIGVSTNPKYMDRRVCVDRFSCRKKVHGQIRPLYIYHVHNSRHLSRNIYLIMKCFSNPHK